MDRWAQPSTAAGEARIVPLCGCASCPRGCWYGRAQCAGGEPSVQTPWSTRTALTWAPPPVRAPPLPSRSACTPGMLLSAAFCPAPAIPPAHPVSITCPTEWRFCKETPQVPTSNEGHCCSLLALSIGLGTQDWTSCTWRSRGRRAITLLFFLCSCTCRMSTYPHACRCEVPACIWLSLLRP